MTLYVPAVASRFMARRLFGKWEEPGSEAYDFRGRAGPILYVLCVIHTSLLIVFVTLGLLWQALKLVP